jgi:hypothetical protein
MDVIILKVFYIFVSYSWFGFSSASLILKEPGRNILNPDFAGMGF